MWLAAVGRLCALVHLMPPLSPPLPLPPLSPPPPPPRPGADFIIPIESLALPNRLTFGLPAEEVVEELPSSVPASASAPVVQERSAYAGESRRRLETAAPKPAAPWAGPKPTAPLYVERLLLIWTRDSSGGVGGGVTVGDKLLLLLLSASATTTAETAPAGVVLNKVLCLVPPESWATLRRAAIPLPSERPLHTGGSEEDASSPSAAALLSLLLLFCGGFSREAGPSCARFEERTASRGSAIDIAALRGHSQGGRSIGGSKIGRTGSSAFCSRIQYGVCIRYNQTLE